MKKPRKTRNLPAGAHKKRIANAESKLLPTCRLHDNRLLDVSVREGDGLREVMERNAEQSPLLRLPAELRNAIFELVLGNHHIHVTQKRLFVPWKNSTLSPPPKDIDFRLHGFLQYGGISLKEISARSIDELFKTRAQTTSHPYMSPRAATRAATPASQFMKTEMSRPQLCRQYRWTPEERPSRYYNYVYPLDWRSYYRTQPVIENRDELKNELRPLNRFVTGVDEHVSSMIALNRVSRRTYSETHAMVYAKNEYSFDGPHTMNHWLDTLLPGQRSALTCLWVDIEWRASRKPAYLWKDRASDYLPRLSPHIASLNPTLTVFMVSRTVWRGAWAKTHATDRPGVVMKKKIEVEEKTLVQNEETMFEQWVFGRLMEVEPEALSRVKVEFVD